MTFRPEDVQCHQFTLREFFAFWPVNTIHGWAWLTDCRAVFTQYRDEDGNFCDRIHFEKLYCA